MIEKLNNNNLSFTKVNILGSGKEHTKRTQKGEAKKDYIWFPKEVRHKDHTMRYWRGLNEMTKDELLMVRLEVRIIQNRS